MGAMRTRRPPTISNGNGVKYDTSYILKSAEVSNIDGCAILPLFAGLRARGAGDTEDATTTVAKESYNGMKARSSLLRQLV